MGKDYIEIDIRILEYERLKQILTELKSMAETIEDYEDSVFEDYRNMAEHNMREIIDILLRLEI